MGSPTTRWAFNEGCGLAGGGKGSDDVQGFESWEFIFFRGEGLVVVCGWLQQVAGGVRGEVWSEVGGCEWCREGGGVILGGLFLALSVFEAWRVDVPAFCIGGKVGPVDLFRAMWGGRGEGRGGIVRLFLNARS